MTLRHRAISCLAFAVLLQQAAVLPLAGQDREIKLEKAFTTEPGISLTPLYIHDPWYRKEIGSRLEKEEKLTKIETMLAADLSGLSRLMQADEDSQKEAWKQQSLFYRTVAGAAELAGQAVGFFDEAPSVIASTPLAMWPRSARRTRSCRSGGASTNELRGKPHTSSA